MGVRVSLVPIDPSVSISIHQYPSVSISFQEEYDEALKEYKSSEGYKKYLGFMDIIGTHNKI